MLNFTLRHDLLLDPKRYWTLFFDRDFNASLYAFLGFPEWQIVEQREAPDGIVRVVRAIPNLELPGPVAKVLGAGFGYTEEGRFDRATATYRFAMKPTTLEGKLRNEAVMRCEPRGDRQSTRVVEVTAEARIFGIGSMIETVIEKSHRSMWSKSVELFDRWASEHA